MASAGMDLVRSIYDAWGRGDFSSTAWASPEIEFEIVGGPDPGRWSGLAGMEQGWRQWLGAWDGLATEAHEFRELGPGRVIVAGLMRGRGKASGVHVDTEFVNVLDVRDGRIWRLRLYSNRARAFADLGLSI
jgi:ketosteroid isomerase-like protein